MSQFFRLADRFIPVAVRVPNWSHLDPEARRRGIGITMALVLEALLILALLTLGSGAMREEPVPAAMVSFDARPDEQENPSPAETEEPEFAKAKPAALQQPMLADAPVPPAEPPPAEVKPVPKPPALIPLSRDQMARADISGKKAGPPAPAKAGPMGPPDRGFPGDSERVGGSGPNGEPLYAASWYREPYPDELRGYLSTASGPGWALINCQTVPDFRVENCVLEGEAPRGSQIGRAVLAAAWQFRIRPPRVGGRSKVGEWVRIRIDYTVLH
jgi:protein TonB